MTSFVVARLRARRPREVAMRFVLACLLLACPAAPARACLNDREVDSAEREFRSRYGEESASNDEPIELGFAPLGAVGLALVAGAYYIAGRRKAS